MADREASNWWTGSVGYLIYLRSFADRSGNGIGDLQGLTEHLDHLADLGVDLLWVTPFFPSPMADFGYDVADYEAVDPVYGSMADFDQLVADAHARGMRLIIDLVPNHTSIEHPWFREARRGRDNPLRNRYLWADPGPNGEPPNNWVSYFGGPAWTLEPESGQCYLHLFLPEQPDLNWRDPTVVDAFDQILTFWLDRGVDGFRIDVAQALVKDAELRSNPQLRPVDPDTHRDEQWAAFRHDHDVLQSDTQAIFRRWKALCSPRGGFLIGETYATDPADYAELLGVGGLDAGFWFAPLHIPWDRESVEDSLRRPLETVDDPARIGWLTSSQDLPRGATRFGGGDQGRERSLLLAMLMFSLPGLPFLYQGEELGLTDGVLARDQRHDPVTSHVDSGRDGCRTPMPWRPGRSFGFSDAPEPWLPLGGRADRDTVAVQQTDDRSWLARYRRLVTLRRTESVLSSNVEVEWLSTEHQQIISFRREDLVVVANLGDDRADIDGDRLLGAPATVLFNTHDEPAVVGSGVRLAARQGIVVRTGQSGPGFDHSPNTAEA